MAESVVSPNGDASLSEPVNQGPECYMNYRYCEHTVLITVQRISTSAMQDNNRPGQ